MTNRAVSGDRVRTVLSGVRGGRMPALARAISMVENQRPGFEDLLAGVHDVVGRAHRIGITGPPGAGKSTLTDGMVRAFRARNRSVAVVAVDPTSPFTGGALLGDRVRMESAASDPGVFVRSMATRGAVGGLATTTHEVCDLLDAFGFAEVIIETVGVGQSELAVAGSADTTILVLVPESGDGIQVLKAGVMEVADLFVVNKADRDGADALAAEVRDLMRIRAERVPDDGSDWLPPVLLTSALRGGGVSGLVDEVERHATFLRDSGGLEVRRRERLRRHTRDVVERALRLMIWRDGGGEDRLHEGLERVVAGLESPYHLARRILAQTLERRTT